MVLLKEILEKRKASPADEHDDILNHILRFDDNSNSQLTEEQIIDLLITIIYSGFETVSTTSMMCVKYLSDNTAALQELSVISAIFFYIPLFLTFISPLLIHFFHFRKNILVSERRRSHLKIQLLWMTSN